MLAGVPGAVTKVIHGSRIISPIRSFPENARVSM